MVNNNKSKEDLKEQELKKILEWRCLTFIIDIEEHQKNHPSIVYKRKQRLALGSMRKTVPNLTLSDANDIFVPKTKRYGFVLGQPSRTTTMTLIERELLITLIGTNSNIYGKDGIPNGVKAVSFVHEGFVFGGKNSMDFQPTFEQKPGDSMEYYLKTSRVQIATYEFADGRRKTAGACWWFGDDSLESFNLHEIYEVQRNSLVANIQELRREMKAHGYVRKPSEKSLLELSWTNLLKIRIGPDGQDAALLDYELVEKERQRFQMARSRSMTRS